MDYFNLRNEQRSDWSGKAKLKCTVRDFEEVKRAVDYLKAHSLNTIEDLDTAISNLNQTAAPLRRQLKQNENRMRAIAQIKDAAIIREVDAVGKTVLFGVVLQYALLIGDRVRFVLKLVIVAQAFVERRIAFMFPCHNYHILSCFLDIHCGS